MLTLRFAKPNEELSSYLLFFFSGEEKEIIFIFPVQTKVACPQQNLLLAMHRHYSSELIESNAET